MNLCFASIGYFVLLMWETHQHLGFYWSTGFIIIYAIKPWCHTFKEKPLQFLKGFFYKPPHKLVITMGYFLFLVNSYYFVRVIEETHEELIC